MVYTVVLEATAERIESSSLSLRTIDKHTYPTPTRYGRLCSSTEERFKSMFFNGKEFKGGLTSCRRLAVYKR